jgi:uncharacterized protein (TIGR02611 family)
MNDRLRHHWFRLPSKVRKPVVLFVGLACVISAGLIGWLPGPGGIPLFLIGVAILATEYAWAERFKQFTLRLIRRGSAWLRERPTTMWFLISASTVIAVLGLYQLMLIFVK